MRIVQAVGARWGMQGCRQSATPRSEVLDIPVIFEMLTTVRLGDAPACVTDAAGHGCSGGPRGASIDSAGERRALISWG